MTYFHRKWILIFFLSKLKFYLMIVIFFLIKILQINLLSKNEMQFIKRGNGKIDTKEYFFSNLVIQTFYSIISFLFKLSKELNDDNTETYY